MVSCGIRLWYDRGIDPGTEWAEEIANRLLNASVLVVFLSSASLNSRNVRREIGFATSKGKTIIALYLERCEVTPGLQLQMSGSQYVRLDSYATPSEAIERVLAAIPHDCVTGDSSAVLSILEADAKASEDGHRHALGTFILAFAVLMAAVVVYFFVRPTVWEGSGDDASSGGAVVGDEGESPVEDGEVVRSVEPRETFPVRWHGSYSGHTTHTETGNEPVSRSIDMVFDYVSSDGVIRGSCAIESADPVDGYMTCSYTLAGNVDFDAGTIEVYGDEWIEQGGFSYMRRFNGDLDEEWRNITGSSSDLSSGFFEGEWTMEAVV